MNGLPPISVVARDLGCGPIVKDRAAAWFRGGANPRSLTLDDEKGCYYDHGAQRGGGIVALAEAALGGDRHEALAWLRHQYGLGKPDPAMRARRRAAHDAAADLAAWRWRLVQYLRAVRNAAWDAWQAAERQYRGPLRTGDLPATAWRELRQRLKIADRIDSYIARLQALSTPDLIALRQRLEVPR